MKIIIKETYELGRPNEMECFYYEGKTDEELDKIMHDMWDKEKQKPGFNTYYAAHFWIQEVQEVKE